MPVLALNLHAGFACRHSGACCTAGWPIPVEPGAAAAIRGGIPGAGPSLTTSGLLPEGSVAIIAPTAGGVCPFYLPDQGRLCDIQRQLGHEALPAACRHFPRVALEETDAIRVTLSHFCPTAASMLFGEPPDPVAVVEDAAGMAGRRAYDGFDARHTIPPLLRPGVAMDVPSCRIWEAFLLEALGHADNREAEERLAHVAAAADRVRAWRAGEESLESWTGAVLAEAPPTPAHEGGWLMRFSAASRLFHVTTGAVLPGLSRPALPDGVERADARLVLPRWSEFARVIGRYLAARSFGAWSAYLGQGLRTQVAMLGVALAAVRIEAAREALRSGRLFDDDMLLGAIRRADLVLNHLSDAAALVRSQGGVESARGAAWFDAIGLEARR